MLEKQIENYLYKVRKRTQAKLKESRRKERIKIIYLRLPLARAQESQPTAEQSSTGRHWNSPKKIPLIQRQRKSCNETVGGAQP